MVILFVQISTGSLYIHLSGREHTCITWHYSPFHSVALHWIAVHYIALYCITYIHSIHILLDLIVCWGEARQELGTAVMLQLIPLLFGSFCSFSLPLAFQLSEANKKPLHYFVPRFQSTGEQEKGVLPFFVLGKHELIPNFGVGICDNIWVQQQDKALPLKFYSSLANAGYANMDHGRRCCLYFPGKTMETKLRQIPELSLPRMAKY